MIVYKNGKYKSVREPSESKKVLDASMATLSADEKEALKIILEQMGTDGSGSALYNQLGNLEFKTKPVDLKTFIFDEYYLGKTCDVLFPKWFESLSELMDGGYEECVFTGSLGCGKTYSASIGICYLIYLLSIMKDPQKSFGLASSSYIDIVVFSVTEDLAAKVAFENIVSKIEASEYFQTKFPFRVNKKELEFPGKIRISPRATTDNSAVGLNVMSVLMDESDFMKVKSSTKAKKSDAPVAMADNIYNIIKRRMKSRFAKQGKLPGILFVVSSKSSRDSFSERLIKSNMSNPLFFVRDFSTWEVKPEDTFSSAARFWVLAGNESVPSRILTPGEYEKFSKNLPDGCILIDVPEDYRADFTGDIDGSLRDIAGISTISVSPFIQRVEKLITCIEAQARAYPGYSHPFSSEVFEPGTGHQFMWSQMVKEVQERNHNRRAETVWRPKINALAPRKLHIDPSINGDATGICMAHICGWKDVQRTASDGVIYTEKAPIYFIDFVLRVVPPVGSEIVLGDTRQLIYDLSSHGYVITSITYDSYQSIDATQILKSKGYTSDILSVDRTMDPYEILKTAIYEDRVLMYRYEPLLEELRTIKKDIVKRKIDHDPGKSKDIADALAGCIYGLSKTQYSLPMPILRDSPYEGSHWSQESSTIIPGNTREATEMWQDILPPFIVGGDS